MARSKPAKVVPPPLVPPVPPVPPEPASDGASPPKRSRKQAVVLIHGMGEQVPLGTLREFVETVYQRDPNRKPKTPEDVDQGEVDDEDIVAAARPRAEPGPKLNRIWMVPDDATGTAELRRITTPPDAEGRRTDFFELYWADITEGTPVEAVLGWIKGLILRPYSAVPRSLKVQLAWIFLWIVSALFVVFTISTLDPTGALFSGLITPTKTVLKSGHLLIGFALVGFGLWLAIVRSAGAEGRRTRSSAAPVLVSIVVGIALFFMPQPLLDSDKVWSGLIAFGLAALLNGLIAPYVGDVVRYVRASPSTVDKRRLVRERGIKLLEELHNKKMKGGSAPMYDRIIVVAHSLGSIIGYDIVQLYWEKYGPTHRFPALKTAQAEYAAVDAYVKQWWVERERDSFDIAAYQRAQSELFEVIRENFQFRISDFVTVGSPLAHAQFLLRDDKDALEAEFRERLFSSSPPRPDRPRKTMIYHAHNNASDGPFLHFAAPFAAVRWTNIYDECWFPFGGDIVSGSLREIFGPGIKEHPVRIVRPNLPRILNRLVTHTLYWEWFEAFGTTAPPHIGFLRDALFLEGDLKQRLGKSARDAAAAREQLAEAPPSKGAMG